MPIFLNLNYNNIYLSGGRDPLPLRKFHRPYFLASVDGDPSPVEVERKREEILKKVKRAKKNTLEEHTLAKVTEVGEVEEYKSFVRFGKRRYVFKVYTEKPGDVPSVSNHLFFKEKCSCYEFDIPYETRALTDLAAKEEFWVYDTKGREEKLKVVAYDIETFDYLSKKEVNEINLIGYSDFELTISSSKNLEKEEFNFEIFEIDGDWRDKEVKQLLALDLDEEVRNLVEFIETIKKYDIIAGHNLIDFDNQQIFNRIEYLLREEKERLSSKEKGVFREFLENYAAKKDSYHFGKRQVGVHFYSTSFDTYHAARRFYRFLESFRLKDVALFLGIKIDNRKYLDLSRGKKISLSEWERYNQHDVLEQIAISMHLLNAALPLSFSTAMPLEMVLTTGTTGIWDFMAMIRGSLLKKIMLPTHRAVYTARCIYQNFESYSKKNITETVRKAGNQRDVERELLKFAKYGVEMPDWAERPYSIYNKDSKCDKNKEREEEEKITSYSIPGGMTISPDKEANSHLLPWWCVVAADVGAMYPTILRGMNIGADTVRIAERGEKIDGWIWVKNASEQFVEEVPHIDLNSEESILNNPFMGPKEIRSIYGFADRGYLLGIKCSKETGLVNRAMTGIMKMIKKIKEDLKRKKPGSLDYRRLAMMYQSIKGVRNAGTHGILIASGVSCRQFNVWGGAAITTKGQEILHHVMKTLQDRGMKVVYGDTDGIYIAASKNGTLLPELREPLIQFLKEEPDFLQQISEEKRKIIVSFIKGEESKKEWLTPPEEIVSTIQDCNQEWRKRLNYKDFELETEIDSAMVFVKHKNYLIFNVEGEHFVMETKGNNFKGSDKAEIARTCLKRIMKKVMFSHLVWDDVEETRRKFIQSIKKFSLTEIKKLSVGDFDVEKLYLIQSVSPPHSYKPNKDGKLTSYGKRALALENLIGHPIVGTTKFRFVVTKRPLPGIERPSKSGVKPIDYMYPVEFVKKEDIDLEWYREMVANYIKGAFGLKDLSDSVQFSLTDFM